MKSLHQSKGYERPREITRDHGERSRSKTCKFVGLVRSFKLSAVLGRFRAAVWSETRLGATIPVELHTGCHTAGTCVARNEEPFMSERNVVG